jgi:drug/metabolite transporter (DMT)-like permease
MLRMVLIGALAHALGWLMARRATAQFVWRAWNVLGALLLGVGILCIAYAWAELGLQSSGGSLVLGLGVLLVSAGIWMLVPV